MAPNKNFLKKFGRQKIVAWLRFDYGNLLISKDCNVVLTFWLAFQSRSFCVKYIPQSDFDSSSFHLYFHYKITKTKQELFV